MSLGARLQTLLDECAGDLVSPQSRARVEEAAAPLVDTDAECALECHLDSGGERVDLVVRISRADRDTLLDRGGLRPDLARFLARWAAPAHPLHPVPFVELEYDLDRAEPAPWIGPAIEPLVRRSVDAIAAEHRGLAPGSWASARLARAVMSELGETRDEWHRRIDDVFAELPARGCINHLTLGSARPGRERTLVRAIASLPRTDVDRFMGAVGWRGERRRLGALLARYFPGETRADVDLDIDLEGAAPRTAAYADFRAPRPADSVLRELLERLAEDGLGLRAPIGALAGWIRTVDGSLERALTIKVSDDGRERRTAKAYLGALMSVCW